MIRAVTLLLLLLSTFGLAADDKPPTWVFERTFEDDGRYVFVGQGHDLDPEKAAQIAKADLVQRVLQYVGVVVSTRTQSTVTAQEGSVVTTIAQDLEAQAGGNLSGLRIEAEAQIKDPLGLTVYLRGSMDKTQLDRDRTRRERSWQEPDRAVETTEAAADQHLLDGDPLWCLGGYFSAARSCWNPGVTSPQTQFDRIVLKIRRVISALNLNLSSSLLPLTAGQESTQPLRVSLRFRGPDGVLGVGGAGVIFLVPVRTSEGVTSLRVPLLTGADGSVTMRLPTFSRPVQDLVTVSIDWPWSPIDWASCPPAARKVLMDLQDRASAVRLKVPFTVLAGTSSSSLAVLSDETDLWGRRISGLPARAALVGRLVAAGRTMVSDETAASQVVQLKLKVTEVDRSEGEPLARAEGTVEVRARETGRVLYSGVKSAYASGPSDSLAGLAALKRLGETIANDLESSLP